jgi:hypothetical protein
MIQGKFVSISWSLEKTIKLIPIENVVQTIQSCSKRRSRRSYCEISPTIKATTLSKSSRKSTKRQSKKTTKMLPKHKTITLPTAPVPYKKCKYEGDPIKTILWGDTNKSQYFLKLVFGSNLLKLEGDLNGDVVNLPTTYVDNGRKHYLIITKLNPEKAQETVRLERKSKRSYSAYYAGDGNGITSADDVKEKLEAIGNFSQLALLPGKLCTRLELLLSPACSKCPHFFEICPDDVEMVEENQHDGKIAFVHKFAFMLILSTEFV